MSVSEPFAPRVRLTSPRQTFEMRGDIAAWTEDVAAPALFGELDKVGEIPLLPDVAHQVMTLLGDTTVPIPRIAEVIRRDPALAAQLLRAANTAGLGATRPVGRLSEAVMRLGTNGLRRLLFSVSANRILVVRNRPELTTRLQARSTAVAIASEHLAKANGTDAESAFMAGLLHDVGWAIIHGLTTHTGANVPSDLVNPDVLDAVCEALHERVGERLTASWNLPVTVCAAVGHHHAPESASAGALMAYVVAGGVRIADHLRIGPVDKPMLSLRNDAILARLGIEGESAERLVALVEADIKSDIARA